MNFWRKLVEKFTPARKDEPIDWEALLIEADLGLALTQKWVSELERLRLDRDNEKAQQWIRQQLLALLKDYSNPEIPTKPRVTLLVGVNGSGKTTTAAKLAALDFRQHKKIILGAADTFRAAAVDQLKIWGERLGIPVVTAPDGTDPASVAYRAIDEGLKQGADRIIIDTAGRLANKNNLMLELGKVKRVVQKRFESAPHDIWLVVDGTTGNNILNQAKEFHAAVSLTGIIMTKIDSSAKGGMVAAVQAELGIPTVYLGRGERVEDLEPFRAARFVDEFFGSET